jgi:hypothetical protein
MKAKTSGSQWSFHDVWNSTLDSIQDRPQVKRDYIYASELGGSFIDRYLKMNAVKQTNPANERSKRKFQAGNLWEWIVGMILTKSGILKEKQLRGEIKLPKMLRVSGRLDFIAGGLVDWDKALYESKKLHEDLKAINLELPPFLFAAAENIIKKLSKMMLKEMILETKSCSSFIMEKLQKTGKPNPNHVLQNYHYVLSNKMDEGKLVYICKDDCLIEEFPVLNNEQTLKLYTADIRQMTKYYNAGFNPKKPLEFAPPKEQLVLFDEGMWRFEKNWKVEYSPYLFMLYGYQTPEAYRMAWQRSISSWNRVFKRCVKGDRMTDNNKEAIKNALKQFPDFDKYVKKAIKAGAFQKEEEGEDE